MAFSNTSAYYFRTPSDTGIDKVPLNKLVVILSTKSVFLKTTSTGLSSSSTIQNAIDSGAVEIASGVDAELVKSTVQSEISSGNIDLTTQLGDVASHTLGTGPDQIPRNSDLGTVAKTSVGTGPNQVPRNRDLVFPASTVINTPSITTPANNATGFSGSIHSSAFSASPLFNGTHLGAEWQLSTDQDFTNIVQTSTVGNLSSWSPDLTASETVYYVRVRYTSDNHYSEWSNVIKFTTAKVTVALPTLTVPGAPSSVGATPTLTGSAFTVNGGTDTHQLTDWIVTLTNGTVVWQSLNNTTNKTSITLPANTLSQNTDYVFKVRYKGNKYGYSGYREVSAKTVTAFAGEAVFTTPGTYQWTVPSGVTLISAVCVGAGGTAGGNAGGCGGGLAWKNTIPVVPGQSYEITVGAGSIDFYYNGSLSRIYSPEIGILSAGGGISGYNIQPYGGTDGGGTPSGHDGGGNGGKGHSNNGSSSAGGGAGGYTGNGGGYATMSTTTYGAIGGGGQAGTNGQGGGGVGLYGEGPSGSAYSQGGSGGENANGINGGKYGGGGGGGASHGIGAHGAVRIIWGPGRSFPHNAA